MSYAKPVIQNKPPIRTYIYDDMECVYRANHSLLYKSSRMRHYLIIRNEVGPNEVDQAVIYAMFRDTHQKQYPTSGTVHTSDVYSISFNWNPNTRSFILSRY